MPQAVKIEMKLETRFKADKKITVLFFIVIVAGVTMSVSNRPKVKVPETTILNGPYDTIDTAVMNVPNPDRPEESRISSHEDWGRDPFEFVRGAGNGKKSAPRVKRKTLRLHLSAVLIDGNVRAAVINETVCRRGDIIQGYTVEDIMQGSVTLRKGSKNLVLKL